MIAEIVLVALINQPEKQPANDQKVIQQIAASGRAADIPEAANEKVAPPKMIAPGLPPMLSFRYFEDKKNQRFANLDLMLDDAGH